MMAGWRGFALAGAKMSEYTLLQNGFCKLTKIL